MKTCRRNHQYEGKRCSQCCRENMAALNASLTREERSASASRAVKALNASLTREERSASASRAVKALNASLTPEKRSSGGKTFNARRTPEERSASSRRANRAQRLARVAEDPVAMKMLAERNPRRAKLIRLAFHPATPIHEKRRALDKLTPAPEVRR